MMNRSLGPVWHRKQKKLGILPKGLRGVDKEATWGKSKSKGWVYGHGSFSVVSHDIAFLGMFKWMRNSANEAKKMWLETGKLEGIERIYMDSKADDTNLFYALMKQRKILLVTSPRKRRAKKLSSKRKKMLEILLQDKIRREYRRRSKYVESMQGVVKDVFDLDRCWMRGEANNRWIFAAIGVAVQLAQWLAITTKSSTWAIKESIINE